VNGQISRPDEGGDPAIAFEFLNQISIISQLATTVMERQLPLGLTSRD
jgi:hypothetical protein